MRLIGQNKQVLDYQNEVLSNKEHFEDIKEGFSYYNYDILLKCILYSLLYYITINELIEQIAININKEYYKIIQTIMFGILAYVITLYL
jgi:hypothetical protein